MSRKITHVIPSPSSSKILILPQDYIILELDEYNESDIKNIIWDARCTNEKEKENIKAKIEICCLVESVVVIDTNDEHGLSEWVETTCSGKFQFVSQDDVLIVPNFFPPPLKIEQNLNHENIVVSNVCWPTNCDEEMWQVLKGYGISKLNIALSKYQNVDVHFVKSLKKKLDNAGMSVHSINSIFYGTRLNMFDDIQPYIQQFCRYLDFAHILGAKYIIYGSSSSKFLTTAEKKHVYSKYQEAYEYFSKTINTLANIAEKYSIKIYVKPNKSCNFLFESQHVEDIVNVINHPNVVAGPLRDEFIPFQKFTGSDDFWLLEFAPRNNKQYINRILSYFLQSEV
jgi:hypothetical protein